MALGALLIGGGLLWLSRISDHAVYFSDIFGPLVILSVGFGLIFLPTTLVAVAGAARHETGLASAVLNVSQQLGGSVGLAVLGTVAANVTKNQLAQVRPTHELISHAVTAGFASAFEIGTLIALAGFVTALVVIRVRAQRQPVEAMAEAA